MTRVESLKLHIIIGAIVVPLVIGALWRFWPYEPLHEFRADVLTPRLTVHEVLREPLDVLVYCAGHYVPMRASDASLAELERHLDVNYRGALRVLSAALPHLGAGTHVSLMASVAGSMPASRLTTVATPASTKPSGAPSRAPALPPSERSGPLASAW